jgi:carbon storage regulator
MLVFTRKLGEGIVIGNDIHITAVAIRGKKVRLGIHAPDSVSVRRQELCPRDQMNVTEAHPRQGVPSDECER